MENQQVSTTHPASGRLPLLIEIPNIEWSESETTDGIELGAKFKFLGNTYESHYLVSWDFMAHSRNSDIPKQLVWQWQRRVILDQARIQSQDGGSKPRAETGEDSSSGA